MRAEHRAQPERISRRTFVDRALGVAGALAAMPMVPLIDGTRHGRAVASTAGAGTITTVAGGGAVGNGGMATHARLSTPVAVCLDAAGNLYVADNYFHRIFKVAAGTSAFSTVVGTGVPGYSGDNGPAIAATLNTPYGLTVDASGNIYIADSGNACIRCVDARTGRISTVVGTGSPGYNGGAQAALSAQLNSPRGVALDRAGNLYIADTQNMRVWVVNMGSQDLVLYPQSPQPLVVPAGEIATVAGDGTAGFAGDGGPATQARLNMPMALSFDASGTLYIADYANQRVRAIASDTGAITTLAGTGQPGSAGDGGPSVGAMIRFPSGLAVDSHGNLYIGQQQAGQVRKIAAGTQIISTVAGWGPLGFSGDGGPASAARLNAPTGVAVDSHDNLYIADYNNARVRLVAANSATITTVAGSSNVGDWGAATSAVLNEPAGLAVLGAWLLIADQGNHRIRVVGPKGNIATVAGRGVSGFSGDGGPAWAARLNLPCDIKVDGQGNLYIADLANSRIRRVDAQTHIITTVVGSGLRGYGGDNGPAAAAHLNGPRAIVLDANGNLYIADVDNARVRFVNLGITTVTLYAGSPQALTVPPGQIMTVVGTGQAGSAGDGGAATVATINQPRGVALDALGNLYVTEGGRDGQTATWPPVPTDSRIRKVDATSGIISTIAGTDVASYNGDNIPATTAEIDGPRGVAIDSVGNMYIADSFNQRVRRVDRQTGLITTVVGTGAVGYGGDGGPATSATMFLPRYVALYGDNILFVTDQGNSRIRRISLV